MSISFSRDIFKEASVDDGDTIVVTRIRRDVRIVNDTESFGTKELKRETILSSKTYHRKKFGPTQWYSLSQKSKGGGVACD